MIFVTTGTLWLTAAPFLVQRKTSSKKVTCHETPCFPSKWILCFLHLSIRDINLPPARAELPCWCSSLPFSRVLHSGSSLEGACRGSYIRHLQLGYHVGEEHAEVMGSDRVCTSFMPHCSPRALCLRASSGLTKSFSRDADRISVWPSWTVDGRQSSCCLHRESFCLFVLFNFFEVWGKFDFTKVQSEAQLPTSKPLVFLFCFLI